MSGADTRGSTESAAAGKTEDETTPDYLASFLQLLLRNTADISGGEGQILAEAVNKLPKQTDDLAQPITELVNFCLAIENDDTYASLFCLVIDTIRYYLVMRAINSPAAIPFEEFLSRLNALLPDIKTKYAEIAAEINGLLDKELFATLAHIKEYIAIWMSQNIGYYQRYFAYQVLIGALEGGRNFYDYYIRSETPLDLDLPTGLVTLMRKWQELNPKDARAEC